MKVDVAIFEALDRERYTKVNESGVEISEVDLKVSVKIS